MDSYEREICLPYHSATPSPSSCTKIRGEGIQYVIFVYGRVVVTKDVEPFAVVGGNPAKFIKKRVLKDD